MRKGKERRPTYTRHFFVHFCTLVVWFEVFERFTIIIPASFLKSLPEICISSFSGLARTVLRVEIISRIRSLSRISNQALMTTDWTIAVNKRGERKFSFNWKILSSSHFPLFSSQHTNFPEVRNKTKNSEKLKCVKLLAQSRVKVASYSSFLRCEKFHGYFPKKKHKFSLDTSAHRRRRRTWRKIQKIVLKMAKIKSGAE